MRAERGLFANRAAIASDAAQPQLRAGGWRVARGRFGFTPSSTRVTISTAHSSALGIWLPWIWGGAGCSTCVGASEVPKDDLVRSPRRNFFPYLVITVIFWPEQD